MRSLIDTAQLHEAQNVALIGPDGTQHGLVELWHVTQTEAGKCLQLLGHYPTVQGARRVAEQLEPGSCYFQTGPGACLLRLETGCN